MSNFSGLNCQKIELKKMNKPLCLLIVFLCSTVVFSQEKKTLTIKRATTAPKIDAVLDDIAWQEAEVAKDFVQFEPAMSLPEEEYQKSIVKVTYDDKALYFAAYLHDDPDNIMKQLTSRDNDGQSDFFQITINPNNDAQNNTEFVVFSTGTQRDAAVNSYGYADWGWNAVWDSAVKIVDDGWILEIKIPYAALRFSNQEVQTWGIQFQRGFRSNETQYSWNPIDKTKGKIGLYHGELKGIKNIDPPTRLSFYPFTSVLLRNYDGETSDEYRIGLDVKYGITENFTLDATLIPDFSQARFDNVKLNLGPFEQYYSEQRQFFKEGVDLFNKGDLFYSRRIGNSPVGQPILGVNEEIVDYPSTVKLLNAIKVSGRTKDGWGIGFFNAITEKTEATIKDNVTQETHREIVEPFANYNILVVDKQFNNNSSVSLINTNVTRDGNFRDANVTGGLFDITNKNNTFSYGGEFKMSHLNLVEEDQTGFSSQISFRKVSGKYQFGIYHNLADEKYNINDLGIKNTNNYNNIYSEFSYKIFKPTKKFNIFRINAWANYKSLFKPGTYTGNEIGIRIYTQTKKLWYYGGKLRWKIGKQYDYWEPRTEGRYFAFKDLADTNLWFETNNANPFVITYWNGISTIFDKDMDYVGYWIGLLPRMHFSDKFIVKYSFYFQSEKGDRGFVTNIGDEIIFGQRKRQTIENSISGTYNFNSFHSLDLTFRNYWSKAKYRQDLYTLLEDGSVTTNTGHHLENIDFDPNVNFITWNLDFRYSWEFAPGSQLTALYRNTLISNNTMSNDTYFNSLETLFKQPKENIFSLRLVYYIDYNNIKNLLNKKDLE
jgi:hypothetical protein